MKQSASLFVRVAFALFLFFAATSVLAGNNNQRHHGGNDGYAHHDNHSGRYDSHRNRWEWRGPHKGCHIKGKHHHRHHGGHGNPTGELDCSNAKASPKVLWPANHRFTSVDIDGLRTIDGSDPVVTIQCVYQDEPLNGIGDGNTDIDAKLTSSGELKVRKERVGRRVGNGNGRVYHVDFEAQDTAAGESCEGSVAVEVPHRWWGKAKDDGRLYVSLDNGFNCGGDSNQPPAITSSPVLTAMELTPYEYPVIATDPEGDTLGYRLLEAPNAMTVSADGLIQWTPDQDEAGDYAVTVEVNDGDNAVEQSFTLTVSARNNTAPVMTSTPVLDATEEQSYSYQLTAVDNENDNFGFSLAAGPTGLSISLDGLVQWTPNEGQAGDHPVSIEVIDALGAVGTQNYTITVAPKPNNTPEILSTPVTSVNEDATYEYTVLATDPEGTALTYSLTTSPSGITLTDNVLEWATTFDDAGEYPVEIQVEDAEGATASQAFLLTVIDVNRAPLFTSVPTLIVAENGLYQYTPEAADDDGDTVTLQLVSNPDGMVLNVDGIVEWMPSYNDAGLYDIEITADDGRGGIATDQFQLTVTNTNRDPQITSEPIEIATENTLYSYQVEANDDDDQSIVYSLVEAPDAMTISDEGLIEWTPGFTDAGDIPVEVAVTDSEVTITQSFVIAVANANQLPVAVDQAITTAEDTPSTITLGASDADADALTYTISAQPTQGTAVLTDSQVEFTPAANFFGTDSFTFFASDAEGDSELATVTITITAVNDAPVISYTPVLTGQENIVYTADVDANDVEGDLLMFSLTAAPLGMTIDAATGVISWLPGFDQAGDGAVTVVATDALGASDTFSFTVVVANTNQPPSANDFAVQADEDQSVTVVLQGSDNDGDVVSYTVLSQPTNGAVTGTAPNLTYTPNANYNGSDSFTYRTNDGAEDSSIATVSITVNPVNDAPVAQSLTAQMFGDSSEEITLSATDEEGGALTFSVATAPTNGSVTIDVSTATYTPTVGFVGNDSFSYVANDGGLDSAPAIVNIAVDAPNNPPVITSTPENVGLEGEAYGYAVIANDPDGDSITYTLVDPPSGMVIDELTGVISWDSPVAGEYTVSIAVSDSFGGSSAQVYGLFVVLSNPPVTNMGKDFWFMFNENVELPENLWLYISSNEDAIGILEIPGIGHSESFSVSAGSVTLIRLNDTVVAQLQLNAAGQAINTGIHVYSDADIALYFQNNTGASSDASIVLPTHALGSRYMVSSYNINEPGVLVFGGLGQSLIGIVATEDNTRVKYTPTVDADRFVPVGEVGLAGEEIEVILNRGETIQEKTRERYADFSGTIIEADKPVAVFSGNTCTNVPGRSLACDHLIEQIPPLSSWSNEYFTFPLATRVGGDTFRVLASEDNTFLWIDDVLVHQLSQGEFEEFTLVDPSHIRANKPILVSQFSNSERVDQGTRPTPRNYADPFMVIVPPSDMFLREYVIATPPSGVTYNYVNVVVPTTSIESMKLDGTVVAPALFTPIGTSEYSGAQLEVSLGSHTLSADEPFGLYVYGFDFFDSYGYIGGMAIAEEVPIEQLNVQLEDSQVIGDYACISGDVYSLNGRPLYGSTVSIEVEGRHPRTDTVFTNLKGEFRYCYRGVSVGEDYIDIRAGQQSEEIIVGWQFTDTPSDGAPEILGNPNLYVTPGELYTYSIQAVDPEGLDLSYTLVEAPAGMAVDGSGVISWLVPADFEKDFVAVEVLDAVGQVATQIFQLSVKRPRHEAMTLTSNPPGSVIAFQQMEYVVEESTTGVKRYVIVTSPDSTNIARFSSRSNETNVLSWTPTNEDVGLHEFEIAVSDGLGSVERQSFTVNVIENLGPEFISSPLEQASVGIEWRYRPEVVDPEGDRIYTSNLLYGPPGMRHQFIGDEFYWTPNASQVGTHEVEVQFLDVNRVSNTQVFTLTVFDNNAVPIFSSTPILNAIVGQTYTYNITGSDPDGDPINSSLLSAPSGMTLIGNTLSWLPSSDDVGNYNIEIRLDDGKGGTAYQVFSLAVTELFLDASIDISPDTIFEGDTVTLQLNLVDVLPPVTVDLTIDGVATPVDENFSTVFTAQGIGAHQVEATITDQLNSVSVSGVYVVNVFDIESPLISLSNPVDAELVTAPVDIVASISDANLASWQLGYRPAGDIAQAFISLASGTTPETDQVLAQFDTTLLDNGQYTLLLEATDLNGNQSQESIAVTVEGGLKVGNFSFTVEDMKVPLAGLPIRVTRTYDSRRKNDNLDFGYGWSIGYQDARVDESRAAGLGWVETSEPIVPSVPAGPQRYCLEPLGAPIVSVKLPTGEVERFEAAASPRCQDLTPRGNGIFSVVFNAVGDNQSTLESIDASSGVLVGGDTVYTSLVNGEVLNPNRYRLTTRSGYIYDLDQDFGIEEVVDPNGQTLTFSDTGIVHSTGKSVQFVRDANGRIEQVIDPAGNAINYGYSPDGDLLTVTERDTAVTTHTYYGSNCSPILDGLFVSLSADCHLLDDMIDPLGRTLVKNIYDASGRLIAQEDQNGIRTDFNHDIAGRQSIITDRNGNTTVFAYDDRGNVTSQVDALGNTRSMTYDAQDNQLMLTNELGDTSEATYNSSNDQLIQTDELGNTITFAYNVRGQATLIVDARLHETEMDYDSIGNLLTVMDPAGNVAGNDINAQGLVSRTVDKEGNETLFTYDGEGNKLTETDAESNVTTYTYDDNNNALTETRPREVAGVLVDEVTTYEYDSRNRVTATIDPLGHRTETEYDLAGNVTARVDALDRRAEMDYDVYGNLLETRYADGTTETHAYDAENNRTSTTDRLGRVMRFSYDALNRQVRVTHPDATPLDDTDNPFTQTEYDAAGRVIAKVDERGNRTTFENDAAGRRTATIDALNNRHEFDYDEDGNLISETDANLHTTSYTYNSLDQRTQSTFANSSTMVDVFDALSRRMRMTDQAGIDTDYAYDGLGRLIKVTQASPDGVIAAPETTYTYDEQGNKLTQTDAEGRTTNWTYDALGRVLTRTLPLGQVESFVYDALGNQESHTDFNGNTHAYTYDVNNRLTQVDYADGMVETFSYDAVGNRTQATKLEGGVTHTTNYIYDSRDRLISETQFAGSANEVTLSYAYDVAGNRIEVTQTRGALTTITRYTFDVLNRLATVTDAEGNVTTYSYDAAGNRIGMAYANANTTAYVYDELNRLTELTHADSASAILQRFSYSLDPTGRRTQITEANGRTTDYSYDNLYRLLTEDITDAVNGNYSASYVYDLVGNRTQSLIDGVTTAYTYDDNDRLTQYGGTTYTYDAIGNTLTDTLGGVVKTYSYNSQNEMIAIDDGVATTVYRYNVDGIRVSQSNAVDDTVYVVDSNRDYAQVLEEVVNGVNVVNYVYGDDLISQNRASDFRFYHYDGLGSTRNLSDAAGTLIDAYDYEAFGKVISQTGSSGNSYLFTGEQFDAGLDQYYLRARYYDQGVGRFTQMDTWMGNSQDPITLNKYLYANVDPANRVDPTGNFSIVSSSTAVTISSTLSRVSVSRTFGFTVSRPGVGGTLGKGSIIGAGVLLMQPGFDLRNAAIQSIIYANSVGDPELLKYANEMYKDAGRYINFVVGGVNNSLDTFEFANSIRGFANAAANLKTQTYISVSSRSNIQAFSFAAARLEKGKLSVRTLDLTSITTINNYNKRIHTEVGDYVVALFDLYSKI